MRKIVSRPEPRILPDFPMPVHIRSSGYNEAEYGWSEFEPKEEKPFVQLFWCVQGRGEILLPDRTVVLNPGETFYHLPYEDHHHRSCDPENEWCYYWFTFDGPAAEAFIGAYGYSQESMYSGECPVSLFLELEMLVRKHTPYAQRHALSVAAEILALAGGTDDALPPEEGLVKRFLRLARESMRDPGVTVELLARKLGVHRTTLTALFRAEMEITPGAYLDNLRLLHALSLLRETGMPVKEVAEHSGFMNISYFCRLVRKAVGCPPLEYRRKAGAAAKNAGNGKISV